MHTVPTSLSYTCINIQPADKPSRTSDKFSLSSFFLFFSFFFKSTIRVGEKRKKKKEEKKRKKRGKQKEKKEKEKKKRKKKRVGGVGGIIHTSSRNVRRTRQY